jgi:hypothetical protein
MSKIDLSDVSSGYNRSKINSNFQKIEDELNQKVLYRDSPSGEANQMEVELDMNSNPISNVGLATELHQAISKQQMEDYISANASGLVANFREVQTGVAGQTTIVLTTMVYQPNTNSVSLYINGVRQAVGSYTEVGFNTIVLSEALEGGEKIELLTNQITDSAVEINPDLQAQLLAIQAAESNAVASAANALTSEQNALVSAGAASTHAADAAGSAATADGIATSLAGGTIGFDAVGYDFGWVVNETTYFNRDFGSLV